MNDFGVVAVIISYLVWVFYGMWCVLDAIRK